jgi:hypothetical protein
MKGHCRNGLKVLGSEACPAKMAQLTKAFLPKAEIGESLIPTDTRWLAGRILSTDSEGSGQMWSRSMPISQGIRFGVWRRRGSSRWATGSEGLDGRGEVDGSADERSPAAVFGS